jgi:RHS repeat-associated protein
MIYPNGVVTTYSYDSESRLTRLTANRGAAVLTDLQYTFSDSGNITRKQTPEFTEDYQYDGADQLVEAVRTGQYANRWYYSYDAAGNRTTEQIGDSPTVASFDSMNRLLSTSAGGALTFKGTLNEPATVKVQGKPAAVDGSNKFEGPVNSSSGTNTVSVVATDPNSNTRTNTYEVNVSGTGKTFSYDANGNLTQKVDGADTWTYEWNAENQLKKVLKNASEVARFAYDPLGRRVEKVAGGTTTTFTYDAEDILRESAGATTTYYIHGPGIDEPLAKEVSGSATYFHADGLGSVLKMTNASGTVTHEYRYDAYGRIEAGSTVGGYSFTGREWDPECGLFYYRARFYDPNMGRFLSEDPLGLGGGPNRYAYVGGNPVMHIDPYGLFNPTKGASALLNAANAGRLYGGALLSALTAAGLTTAGPGNPGSVGTAALAIWKLNAGLTAQNRAFQQWNEALCESSENMTLRNLYGTLPYGTQYDDPWEPTPLEFADQLPRQIENDPWRFVREIGTLF